MIKGILIRSPDVSINQILNNLCIPFKQWNISHQDKSMVQDQKQQLQVNL